MISIFKNGQFRTHGLNPEYSGEKIPGELSGFQSYSADPNEWNKTNYSKVRDICATLYNTSELARAAVDKPLSYIIGKGLKFRSAINAGRAGMDEDEAQVWSERFTQLVDETKRDLDYYQSSVRAVREFLMLGEALLIFVRGEKDIIERIIPASPTVEIQETRGLVLDEYNTPVGINRKSGLLNEFNGNGRRNYILMRRSLRPGQIRGVGVFHGAISRIKNYDRIWDATINKMIQESIIIGQAKSGGEVTSQMADIAARAAGRSGKKPPREQAVLASTRDVNSTSMVLDLGGSEGLEFFKPGTPGNNFAVANEWALKLIAASVGYPPEFLIGEYSTSFTAHKGALNDAMKQVTVERELVISELERKVIEELYYDLIARGELKKQPGEPRRYMGGHFIPPQPGHINPLQEAKAYEVVVRNGWIENSGIADNYGRDYKANEAEASKQYKEWRDRINDKDTE